MRKGSLVKKLNEVISDLPERKLETLYEIACFLQSRRNMEGQGLFKMQIRSHAYKEWLSAENDVYDEIFKDEIKKR